MFDWKVLAFIIVILIILIYCYQPKDTFDSNLINNHYARQKLDPNKLYIDVYYSNRTKAMNLVNKLKETFNIQRCNNMASELNCNKLLSSVEIRPISASINLYLGKLNDPTVVVYRKGVQNVIDKNNLTSEEVLGLILGANKDYSAIFNYKVAETAPILNSTNSVIIDYKVKPKFGGYHGGRGKGKGKGKNDKDDDDKDDDDKNDDDKNDGNKKKWKIGK